MPIYLQHGNLIDYVPPTDTSTEDVVFMGGLVGVPQTFIQAGELGALSVDGVYMFNKKDGVSVNLGDVVKYCGTTKLAQDSNADLTLGVAVSDAEANDFGVKVKINSVLPNEGGGGGDIEIDTSAGLGFGCGGLAVKIGDGLQFGSWGEINVTCGGGGGGLENLATGYKSLSILGEATTSMYSISVGSGANASDRSSIALGENANASGSSSIALGASADANVSGSIALGVNANASGLRSNALGYNSTASGNDSIALGNNTLVRDQGVASIGSYMNPLRTQLYVIAERSPLSQQYLNGKSGLAYAVWGDDEIYPNGKVKEGKIIALETLFANGVDFVPSMGGDDCCSCCGC